jgi:hypothetical protein
MGEAGDEGVKVNVKEGVKEAESEGIDKAVNVWVAGAWVVAAVNVSTIDGVDAAGLVVVGKAFGKTNGKETQKQQRMISGAAMVMIFAITLECQNPEIARVNFRHTDLFEGRRGEAISEAIRARYS